MKIMCETVKSFLENVQTLGAVYGSRIFVQRSEVPLNGTKRQATSFEIALQCATVMDLRDGAQVLLLCGEYCGIDRTTADGNRDGTLVWEYLRSVIQVYCLANNLTLLPGTLEL